MSLREQFFNIGLSRRQSVIASIQRKCPTCFHSGYDAYGRTILDVCPQCGTPRPPLEPQGEVWVKEWRSWPWSVVIPFLRKIGKSWKNLKGKLSWT